MARFIVDGAGIRREVKSLTMPLESAPPPAPTGRIVLAEHAPGPGWVSLGPGPARGHTSMPMVDHDPQRMLHERVESLAAAGGLSYADALRAVVTASPELWQRVRASQPNGVC
jgi:hypothetical protein